MSKPMVQTEGRCSMAKVTTMAWRVPTKQMRVVRESGAAYCLRVCACRMKSEAQARVAMMTKRDPRNHSLPLGSTMAATGASAPPCTWLLRLLHAIFISGPLYSVIIIAPATVTSVPATFAWHLTFFRSTFSILKITAMTKVMAGSMLLMAHAKVGPVNFNPA
jgi:hypothetical protein